MLHDVYIKFQFIEKGKIYKFAFTTKRTDYPEMPNTGLSINDLTYDAVIAQEWEVSCEWTDV